MAYTDTPEHEAEAQEQASELAYLESAFLAAARKGDMNARATFAPMVRDWSSQAATDLRPQTVGECLNDAHDWLVPLHDYRLVGLLCAAARGENVQATAQALLAQLAAKWADMTVGSAS